MEPRLSHLGIAVAAHDEALRFWRDLLGLPLVHSEHVASEGVKVAMLRLGAHPAGAGGGAVELLQPDPVAPGSPPNAVAKFLEQRGGGIHHVAFEVDDVAALAARLAAGGVRLINEQPRKGAHDTLVVFVHPKSTGGVLVELVQPAG